MPMEVTLERETSMEQVSLEPFIHQVGGHSSILTLDETTVCKPMVQREVEFYKNLPLSMREFTAEFKGIVEVSSVEDENGAITLCAKAPAKLFKHHQRAPRKNKLRILRSGRVEIESRNSDVRFEERGQSKNGSKLTSASVNPWVVKCHKQHLNEVAGREYAESKISHNFIVLENLTSKMAYPCVLDLKMGIRNFGDGAPPSKVESQKAKGAATTTGTLGVRICGMQVYQRTTGGFLCWNKYHGRGLTVDGFHDALCQFLDNGEEFRLDLVSGILCRLRRLRAALESLETFRFYCSSLLIIYEGGKWPVHRRGRENDDQLDMTAYEGSPSSSSSSSSLEGSTSKFEHFEDDDEEPRIQVKLIDFAHATFEGFDGPEYTHVGPDHGLIFGITNLISIFESILHQH